MRVEYGEKVILSDFDVPTVEQARKLIADGATNGRDLLEQAGLSREEAEAEVARLAHPRSAR